MFLNFWKIGPTLLIYTVQNLHFLSINSTLISQENCRFYWVKNSWKCCGFGLFHCWQLWFHEKNCQKKNWVKNSWKCCGFVKIEFLEKNLTFRIVCMIWWFRNIADIWIWTHNCWVNPGSFILQDWKMTQLCLLCFPHEFMRGLEERKWVVRGILSKMQLSYISLSSWQSRKTRKQAMY